MNLLGALFDPQFRGDVGRGLLDAGNRGAVAGLLGGPVDLASMAMRPFGYGVENPVGGSEWIGQKMQNLGLVSGNRNALAEILAGVAVPGAAGKVGQAAYRAENALAPKAADMARKAAEGAMVRNGLLQPATVWHGSPHKFDRFDASKIGTGEGAQAYGHGIYTAEAPDVARSYQVLGGVELRDKTGKAVPVPPEVEWVANDLIRSGGDFKKVREALVEHGKDYPWPAEMGTRRLNEWEAAGIAPQAKGSIYKVDLPDSAISRMLDWDKPLSQQPEMARKFSSIADQVRGMPDALQSFERGSTTGETLHSLMRSDAANRAAGSRGAALAMDPKELLGPSQRMAAERLRSLGIPGIRYLDGQSRGTAGTSNYVVFPGEEGLLRILERNGQAPGK